MGSASVRRPTAGCVALAALLVQCATASSVEPTDDGASEASADAASETAVEQDVSVAPDAPDAPIAPIDTPAEDVAVAKDAPDVSVADVPTVTDVPVETSACGAAQAMCGAECVTLSSDERHCGGCGRACASGERCEAGACALSCASGQSPCMGADGVLQCVTLASDRSHCGVCGRACLSGEVCTASRCVTSCPTGQVACTSGGMVVCSDLTRDARSCGMCNLACLATETCEMGACRLNCPGAQTACTGTCVNLQSNVRNCGACENECPAEPNSTSSCVTGRCAITCAAGFGNCNAVTTDGCEVDLSTSATHCGACGTACRTGLVCTAGTCSPLCASPTSLCAGTCVLLASNTRNCGTCGNVCPTGASATATCTLGRCGLTCAAGHGNCDGVATNGCEVDFTNTAAHCGSCATACATGSTCVASVCTAPRRVLESFDAGVWPRAPWVAVAATSSGTLSTGCAHDGTRGLQDPEWYYRTDTVVGTVGQKLSAWVRGGTGRFYMGFGADSTGGFSFVAEPNTSQIEFQRNAGYGYSTLSTAAQTFTAGMWYRLEVTFNSTTSVTGRLYGADGTTVINTLAATVPGFVARGIAMRSFGNFCVDTIELR